MDGLEGVSPLLYSWLLALSVFNTVLLLWLGLTVLLNTARRSWGMWLAGLGLLSSGLFFLSHTMLVVQSELGQRPSPATWWPGWLALIIAPFAWYLAMLWHAGYWERLDSPLRGRHRSALVLASVCAGGMLVTFLLSRPAPSNMQLLVLYFIARPVIAGIPALALFYPPYAFCCTLLALDAVWRPDHDPRALVGPARARARPWLLTAAATLAGLGAFAILIWVYMITYSGGYALEMLADEPQPEAVWLAQCISLPITAAVVLIGEAVAAYEIFTGSTLPRRGLRRQWKGALLLAAGFAVTVAVGILSQLSALYALLLSALAVPAAYALFGWRSHVEREQHLGRLRPFLAGEHSFEAVLGADPSEPSQAPIQFAALCRDLLSAGSAYLLPAGGLSTLVEQPLTYPEHTDPPSAGILRAKRLRSETASILDHFATPDAPLLALDPARYQGAIWAVPLWSARGLAGVFLLGEKSDGGLYSQEEIEIARAGGERLLDTLAVVNLARRLMLLQRQRYIETQVIDQQSRRALHDEVLPGLHSAMLSLRGAGLEESATGDTLGELAEVHRRISALLREMPAGRPSQVAELGLLGALREVASVEFARDLEQVTWQIEPEAESRAKTLPPVTSEIAFYAAKEAMRNAARHGRGEDPARPLRLTLEAVWRDGLELRISDDGVGGVDTRRSLAAGHGFALHGAMLAVIGGSLEVSDEPGAGTTVILSLPGRIWQEA